MLDKQDEETPENTKEAMKNSFEKFFEKSEGCWIWTGAKKDKMPYGDFVFRGKKWIAHRVSYHVYKGDIPQKTLVLHLCDNPSCVNPDHLTLGTHLDNHKDMMEKGRNKVEKLSIEQVKEIKILIEQGDSCRSIAKKYSVSNVNISNIKNKKIWSWV
jgi:hypothetical protein